MIQKLFTKTLTTCGIFSILCGNILAQDLNDKSNIFFDEGKLTFQSKDKAFKLKLDNRIYTDLSFYLPTESVDGLSSKPNKDIEEDDGVFRFNNGASIRRARFAIKATMYEKWFAELDMDFAYNEVELKDLYLGYKFNRHLSIKAGHFKEPMSMERVTSSRYLSFNERPMPVEMFAGGRRLGAAVTAWNNHWWASGGVFGQQIDIIQKEKEKGRTMLFSSHVFSEVERVSDRIVVIKDGKIAATIPKEVIARGGQVRYELSFSSLESFHSAQNRKEYCPLFVDEERRLLFYSPEDGRIADFLAFVSSLPVDNFHARRETLREIFLSYYQEDKEYTGL